MQHKFWIKNAFPLLKPRHSKTAMYKIRNTGTGNGMRGTRGMEGMLYSGECPQTFWGMLQTFRGISPNILGNVIKHSGECCQTFQGPQIFRWMLPNITRNVLKHSRECPQTFWRISSNILGNVTKHSGECHQTFWGMSPNITGNVLKYSREWRQRFRGNIAQLLSLISECFTIHYVLINLNKGEYLYNFPVSKNVLLANPKETF